jgi:hypothetical protein
MPSINGTQESVGKVLGVLIAAMLLVVLAAVAGMVILSVL